MLGLYCDILTILKLDVAWMPCATRKAHKHCCFDLCKGQLFQSMLSPTPQEHSTSEDRPGFIANRILMPYINEARSFEKGCIMLYRLVVG